jgi:ankyrin repeat protein
MKILSATLKSSMFKIILNTTHISNEPTIISTNEECSNQLLQEKSNNKSVVYLRISEDNDFLIISVEENHIHIAVFKGNVAIAELLIEKGAFVNARKITNEIPLHRAA